MRKSVKAFSDAEGRDLSDQP